MKVMKKLVLVVCLLLTSITIANAKTIKLKECEYTDAYIRWLELSDKERKETPMPTVCKNVTKNKYAMVGNSISNASASDSKFDLRDYNKVTSVKNQGTTGACWAFATNAAIESNLLMHNIGEYDLSEAHLELATQDTYDYGRKTFSRDANTGGSADWTSLAYFMNGWGPVEESYLPFQKLLNLYDKKETIDSSLITGNKALFDINYVNLLGNNDGACSNNDINNVKKYLISEGALTTAIYLDPYSSRKDYLYYDGLEYTDTAGDKVTADQSVNHGVTIVGWDDTIGKDKFGTTTTNNGAFIIKNSYGTKTLEGTLEEFKNALYSSNKDAYNSAGITSASQVPDSAIIELLKQFYGIDDDKVLIEDGNVYTIIGMDGYHYISYDDVRVCNILTGFTNIDNKPEDNNYGYTNLGANNAYGYKNTNEMYTMSKYTKKSNENEILKEIVTVFAAPGLNYTIYFADKDTDIITEAEVVAKGTSKFSGMETIEVTNKKITSNVFTIFIKLENENKDLNEIYFHVSLKPTFTFNNPFASFEATPDVEYISADAETYSDVSDKNFNLALKVNTNLESTDGQVTPPAGDDDNGDDTPVNPPAGDDDDGDDTPINPPAGDNEENKTPEDNNENVTPPADDKEDYPNIDEDKVNDDGKIEIEENEYNKENGGNQNVDQTIENPKTGLYLPICVLIAIVGVIYIIRRNTKSKVFKI